MWLPRSRGIREGIRSTSSSGIPDEDDDPGEAQSPPPSRPGLPAAWRAGHRQGEQRVAADACLPSVTRGPAYSRAPCLFRRPSGGPATSSTVFSQTRQKQAELRSRKHQLRRLYDQPPGLPLPRLEKRTPAGRGSAGPRAPRPDFPLQAVARCGLWHFASREMW